MATSTLYQSSQLDSTNGSPRSCLYIPRHSLQPKADWRASFTGGNIENMEAGHYRPNLNKKPLILRQHNGVWLPRLAEISQEKPVTPQAQLTEEKSTEDTAAPPPSMSRLRLGRIPKMVRCHVCLSTVKEQHFHNHLFFGAVRCELCFTICQDCRVYEWVRQEADMEDRKCQHIFTYCEDPYDYLLPRLCGSDDCDFDMPSTLPHNLRILQNYLTNLVSLQLREPWSNAIRKCKSHLLKSYAPSSSKPCEDFSSQDGHSVANTMKDTQDNEAAHKKSEDLCTIFRVGLERSTERDKQESDDSENGLLLTQSYDLEHLEQEVEYVELEKHSNTLPEEKPNHMSKPKKRRKISEYRKNQRLTPRPRKRTPTVMEQGEKEEHENNLVKEEVDLPEDGYYLMVREAVEECPMCYEPLYPTMCTVNIRTFLFTVHCPECSLIIFIVPDLPNGLQIITEDTMSCVETIKSHTKIRKVYPRDFFV